MNPGVRRRQSDYGVSVAEIMPAEHWYNYKAGEI